MSVVSNVPSKREKRGTITLTFGETIENHIDTSCFGKGYTYDELKEIHSKFSDDTEWIDLHHVLRCDDDEHKSGILVFRNFLKTNDIDPSELFEELTAIPWDKKYYCRRRKRVLNKIARWNLCFDDVAQEPDYDDEKGRIVSFRDVDVTNKLRNSLPNFFGEKSLNLKCESNYYYDEKKTGIGFHGDAWRNVVIGVRVGESVPLVFMWFREAKPVSEPIQINLNSGDLYVLSEKAVGKDWKKINSFTLRHAAGADKFITYKRKRS